MLTFLQRNVGSYRTITSQDLVYALVAGFVAFITVFASLAGAVRARQAIGGATLLMRANKSPVSAVGKFLLLLLSLTLI